MAHSRLYFENETASISEHPDGYVLFTYRLGKRRPEDLQAVLTHTANLLHLRGWHRILNDQRLMEPFTPEETERASGFWQQRTQEWGYGLCLASVLARNVFARLAATSMRQELRGAGLAYRLFDDEQEAADWLRQQTQRVELPRH